MRSLTLPPSLYLHMHPEHALTPAPWHAAVRRVAPGVAVGKVLIQRQEEKADKEPRLYYSKLPHDIEERQVLLVDPMLATGGSAKKAIELLVEVSPCVHACGAEEPPHSPAGSLPSPLCPCHVQRGVPQDHILFLCVVTCPEGLAALAASYPAVRVVTCAVDSHLNEHKYIVPGLGDFGDRYMGTDGVASTRSGGKNKPAPAHMG